MAARRRKKSASTSSRRQRTAGSTGATGPGPYRRGLVCIIRASTARPSIDIRQADRVGLMKRHRAASALRNSSACLPARRWRAAIAAQSAPMIIVRLVRKPEQRHADVGRHEQQGGEQPRHPPAHVQDRQSEKKMHDQAEPCSHLHIPSNIHRIQEKTERAAGETDIGAIVQAAVGQEVHRGSARTRRARTAGLVPAGKRDTQKQCHRRE